jgi:predicted ATPase
MIAMTYREAELETAHTLDEVLLDLSHERLAFPLNLERFSRDETRDLLAGLFSEEITPEFLDGIFRQTEGNPFLLKRSARR